MMKMTKKESLFQSQKLINHKKEIHRIDSSFQAIRQDRMNLLEILKVNKKESYSHMKSKITVSRKMTKMKMMINGDNEVILILSSFNNKKTLKIYNIFNFL